MRVKYTSHGGGSKDIFEFLSVIGPVNGMVGPFLYKIVVDRL